MIKLADILKEIEKTPLDRLRDELNLAATRWDRSGMKAVAKLILANIEGKTDIAQAVAYMETLKYSAKDGIKGHYVAGLLKKYRQQPKTESTEPHDPDSPGGPLGNTDDWRTKQVKEGQKPSEELFNQAIKDIKPIIPQISHSIIHRKNLEHNQENMVMLNQELLKKVHAGDDNILHKLRDLAGNALLRNAIDIITAYTADPKNDQLNEAKKKEEPKIATFEDFAETRGKGAAKIATNAEDKGGAALLTWHHFKVKAPYYKKAAEGKFNTEQAEKEYKELLEKLYKATNERMDITQVGFQQLVGKIEALGELLIKHK